MRILWINYEYPPLGGGTAIANEYIVKEFRKTKNLKVDVLTSSPDTVAEKYLHPNIRLICLDIGKSNKAFHHQGYLDLLRFFWLSTAWMFKHKNNYDLVHAFSGLPGSITAWLSDLPYLVSFRGADEPGYERRHDFLWKVIKPLLGFIYRHARFLDANSQYLKRLVLKSFPGLKIKVINNGVDRKKFYPVKNPVTQPIILCTSRFGQRKGVEYLIRAMTLIPKIKLLLVGSGKLEPKMKQLVKKLHLSKKVRFLGMVTHDHLAPIYRRAKLFVLPSLSESLSNSLLEALASGLPVVATNVGGNPELVNDKNGILVPAANTEALAEAIIQALNRPWPKINLPKQYSWKKSSRKYLKLYFRQ